MLSVFDPLPADRIDIDASISISGKLNLFELNVSKTVSILTCKVDKIEVYLSDKNYSYLVIKNVNNKELLSLIDTINAKYTNLEITKNSDDDTVLIAKIGG